MAPFRVWHVAVVLCAAGLHGVVAARPVDGAVQSRGGGGGPGAVLPAATAAPGGVEGSPGRGGGDFTPQPGRSDGCEWVQTSDGRVFVVANGTHRHDVPSLHVALSHGELCGCLFNALRPAVPRV